MPFSASDRLVLGSRECGASPTPSGELDHADSGEEARNPDVGYRNGSDGLCNDCLTKFIRVKWTIGTSLRCVRNENSSSTGIGLFLITKYGD
jgi:hypothetical protein